MAGTDKGRSSLTGGASVVLVAPQLGENIGMVARAMLNCGLTKLSLVRPRDGWPNPAAEAAAAGATEVLDGAAVYASTADAVAGFRRVYATTARPRGMVKPVLSPKAAARDLRAAEDQGAAAFASLNLAQAVLIVGYEWFQAAHPGPSESLATALSGGGLPVERGELLNFLERLERALDGGDFFHPPEKRASMVRNLRNIFLRSDLTDAEVRTLHGVVSALLKAGLDGT